MVISFTTLLCIIMHYYATETPCLQSACSSRPAAIRSPAGQVHERWGGPVNRVGNADLYRLVMCIHMDSHALLLQSFHYIFFLDSKCKRVSVYIYRDSHFSFCPRPQYVIVNNLVYHCWKLTVLLTVYTVPLIYNIPHMVWNGYHTPTDHKHSKEHLAHWEAYIPFGSRHYF